MRTSKYGINPAKNDGYNSFKNWLEVGSYLDVSGMCPFFVSGLYPILTRVLSGKIIWFLYGSYLEPLIFLSDLFPSFPNISTRLLSDSYLVLT